MVLELDWMQFWTVVEILPLKEQMQLDVHVSIFWNSLILSIVLMFNIMEIALNQYYGTEDDNPYHKMIAGTGTGALFKFGMQSQLEH